MSSEMKTQGEQALDCESERVSRGARPADGRIAPSTPRAACAPHDAGGAGVAGDESHAHAQKPSSRRRAIVAGSIAAASLALIVVSAFFLVPSASSGDAPAQTAATASEEAPEQDSSVSASSQNAESSSGTPAATAQSGTTGQDAASVSSSGDSSSTSSSGATASGGSSSGAAESPSPAVDDRVTVTVSVSSADVGGPVSASTSATFARGATAYDALMACGLSVNANSSPYGIYVSAIGGLAEKEHGGSSGWHYLVNGVERGYASSAYVLNDGDAVAWVYRTTL